MDVVSGFWTDLTSSGGFAREVAVGIVTAIIIAIVGYFYRQRHRSVIKQITRHDDPDIGRIEYLQSLIFPEPELDPPGVLAEKIRRSKYDFRKRPGSDHCLVLLCHKVNGQINGYISAEYFLESGIIFFWYLVSVHPRKLDAAFEGNGTETARSKGIARMYDAHTALSLIRRLSFACNRIRKPWRYVIAEVDSAHPKHALARLAQFQSYRKALLLEVREQGLEPTGRSEPSAVFKVDIDFMMPLHEPGMVAEAAEHETPAWLVIAAQRKTELAASDEGPVLTRADAAAMLTALQQSYTTPQEPGYNRYIASFYEGLRQRLPRYCRLVQQRSEIIRGSAINAGAAQASKVG